MRGVHPDEHLLKEGVHTVRVNSVLTLNREHWLAAMQKNGIAVQLVDAALKADGEVVLATVKAPLTLFVWWKPFLWTMLQRWRRCVWPEMHCNMLPMQ